MDYWNGGIVAMDWIFLLGFLMYLHSYSFTQIASFALRLVHYRG